MNKKILLSSCCSILVLATAGAAAAQPAGGNAPAAPASQASTISEVIVTAQRRAERLENVPMSVDVVNNEALAKNNIVSFQDISRITVGAQINFSGAFMQPSIRGVSTLTNGNFVENNVSVYVDGFYDPSSVTINADLANVSDVQVLKGPQGALYGRNATGGAILINTLGPSQTYKGHVEATYGSFDNKILNAFVSGPINDRLRFSVSGYLRDERGYLDQISPVQVGQVADQVGKIQMAAARVKLEADITNNLTATVGYNYGFNLDNRVAYYSTWAHVPPSLPRPPLRITQVGQVAFNDTPRQFAIKNQGTVKLAWNSPIGTLTSYTGFTDGVQRNNFDFDGTYADLTYTKIKFHEWSFQQAVDYAITAIDRVDLIIGGMFYRDDTRNSDGQGAPEVFGPNHVRVFNTYAEQVTKAWAVYIDGTYHLTDRLSLNAGGRYSHDVKAFATYNRSAAGVISAVGIDNHAWDKFTPRATIRYELAPRTNVYASWSKGFRVGNYGGGAASAGLPTTPSRPERITAYEVGFKTARGGLRFDTAAFYYDYRDLNVLQNVPVPCPGSTQQCGVAGIFGNAPKAEVYGLDAEVSASPIDRLNVHAGVSLLHAEYKDFHTAIGTGVNAANTLNVTNQIQDWSNQQMARAPKASGNISVDYTVPLPYGSLLLASSVNFTTGFPINNPSLFGPLAPAALQGQQRFRQDGYTLVGAQVTWNDPTDHYYLQVFGSNLTNKTYFLAYNASAFGDYSPIAEPRAWGVKAGYKF